MTHTDVLEKRTVVEILTHSFDDNKSVNYIVKQDGKRKQRIGRLMEYSYNICNAFGKVYLTDDKKGCALVLLPDQKKTSLKSVLWDFQLITGCIGVGNIAKAMSREGKIKALQPKEPLFYLWFIGVEPGEQNKGTGTKIMQQIIEAADRQKRILCLETSTEKNLPWYQKFGLNIYNELDLGYKLYFLKK